MLPGEFIGLAEESGLIVALGREVLERACAQARTWKDVPGAPRAVSVNVSARQLIDPGLYVKVARPFIARIERSSQDLALVRSIVELGRGLGLGVVAEGIETSSQADTLRSLGCPFGQGFFLGRPAAAGRISPRPAISA